MRCVDLAPMCRALVLALTLGAAVPANADLRAGAGRSEIVLTPDMLPIDGFTSILDPLQVRVVLLDDAKTRVAIAVIDQTSIGGDSVAEYKTIVARATKVDPANIWIVASHTFSAPHLFGARGPAEAGVTRYKTALLTALESAASQAATSARPARIGYGAGTSSVNVNRNVPMADGWWLGANDAGPSDKSLGLLRIEGLDKRPVAVLLNYAVQSSVMDQTGGPGGGKAVTTDLGGAAARHVESSLGNGSVALFLTGAAGDQAPGLTARRNVYDKDGKFKTVDIGAAGYSLAVVQGERLGAETLRSAVAIATDPIVGGLAVANGSITLGAQDRPRSLGLIQPSRNYVYPVKGTAEAPYSLVQIGDIALVGVQVELNAATGQSIKRRSPFAHTLVVTMVNGAAKYLPDAGSYRDITYQAMNSSYAPGGAEKLVNQIVADLRKLKSGMQKQKAKP